MSLTKEDERKKEPKILDQALIMIIDMGKIFPFKSSKHSKEV